MTPPRAAAGFSLLFELRWAKLARGTPTSDRRDQCGRNKQIKISYNSTTERNERNTKQKTNTNVTELICLSNASNARFKVGQMIEESLLRHYDYDADGVTAGQFIRTFRILAQDIGRIASFVFSAVAK